VPFVAEFIAKNPVEADLGRTWARRLPEASYLYADDAPGEKPREGWTRAFPHELRGRGAGADRLFYDRWRRSPFADAYLSRMAQAAVDALQLGRGPGTDFLGVSFSALDTAGHDFGPRSHEVQDLLVRLDETIGGLLEHLDRAVGRENYVVALTADHGVAVIPEQMAAEGVRAGRIVTTTVREKIQQALEPILGPGTHVARVVYPEVYFAPGVSETLSAHPAALRAAMEAARSLPGVVRVFRAEELRGRAGRDAVRRAASLSHFPGRSGDLSVLPRPYFILVNPTSSEPPGDATTHGTARRYDACVPLILAGAGIRPGSYANAASPADIAPTLAHLLGITLAHSDGRVLTEALVPPR
jgi:arylsulfatase A-like enzyme